ncbi:oxidoreductase [Salmonella enterica subsp. enterica]|nr:oxidoreductase [Salmonella enterica subsp. enterica]
MAAYAASKSALQGLARGLARDFGPRGITINVVQPGPIDTDINPEDGPMKELMHSFMAIKRHGRPEEWLEWWHGLPVRKLLSSLAQCTPSMVPSEPDGQANITRLPSTLRQPC